MGVVIGSGLAITPGVDGLDENSPIAAYENVVTTANISSDTAASGFPASNLANPATHLRWQGVPDTAGSDEYITVDFSALAESRDIDYLAIARHNLGTIQSVVSVEVTDGEIGTTDENWTEVITERLLANDDPVLFVFNPQTVWGIRLRIQAAQAESPDDPFIAVLYTGSVLRFQRKIYVGHTPVNYGRKLNVTSLRSISGDFLGRIVLNEMRMTSFTLKNITPAWYRTYMDPLVLFAQTRPFFFAWRPGDYPLEVGFVWAPSDPKASNLLPNGLMQVSMDLEGVA